MKKQYKPEVISIAGRNSFTEWAWGPQELLSRKTPQMFGMVGAIIQNELYVCGGGSQATYYNHQRFLSTSKCQSYDITTNLWTTLDIALITARTFAQSMLFENNTWFVLGGEDSYGVTLHTTEYLELGSSNFMNSNPTPTPFSKHCAKMINATHLFTTGGLKNDASTRDPIGRGDMQHCVILCHAIFHQ